MFCGSTQHGHVWARGRSEAVLWRTRPSDSGNGFIGQNTFLHHNIAAACCPKTRDSLAGSSQANIYN